MPGRRLRPQTPAYGSRFAAVSQHTTDRAQTTHDGERGQRRQPGMGRCPENARTEVCAGTSTPNSQREGA